MKTTICDVCEKPIDDETQKIIVEVKIDGIVGPILDLCYECYHSPVVFAEKRRTRTRRAKVEKPKVGRPRGKRSNPVQAGSPSAQGLRPGNHLGIPPEEIIEIDDDGNVSPFNK